jgi:hypothetical protein
MYSLCKQAGKDHTGEDKYVVKKVKVFRYKPGMALGVPGG